MPGDGRHLQRWAENHEVTRYMAFGREPLSLSALEEAWVVPYSYMIFSDTGGESLGLPIGLVGLYDVNWIDRKAELRIVLGSGRGKGVGSTACRAILVQAFQSLNLERVWLGTAAENLAARRCFEKVGFCEEGVLRRDFCRNGVWHDNIRYGILREEWNALRQG